MTKRKSDPVTKIRLSDTPTFLDIIPKQWHDTIGYCFLYEITLTHPKLGDDQIPYIYIGSKSIDRAGKWKHYQSSSHHVMRLLYIGFIPNFKLIKMVSPNKVKYEEDEYITKYWMTEALRNTSLNFSLASKKTSRYMWVKHFLGEIDRRY